MTATRSQKERHLFLSSREFIMSLLQQLPPSCKEAHMADSFFKSESFPLSFISSQIPINNDLRQPSMNKVLNNCLCLLPYCSLFLLLSAIIPNQLEISKPRHYLIATALSPPSHICTFAYTYEDFSLAIFIPSYSIVLFMNPYVVFTVLKSTVLSSSSDCYCKFLKITTSA